MTKNFKQKLTKTLEIWVHYALLLTSTQSLYVIDYTEISCGISFTNMLSQQCKRKWEEEMEGRAI